MSLNLASNGLLGTIPSGLSLDSLLLFSNDGLSGTVPAAFVGSAVAINHTALSGTLPSQLSNLTTIDLRFTRLSGTVPDSIGGWQQLAWLGVGWVAAACCSSRLAGVRIREGVRGRRAS